MTSRSLGWPRRLLSRHTQEEAGPKETTGGQVQAGEPVEVYVAAHEMEAQVVKGYLESNGIPVVLLSEAIGPTLAVAIGPLAEVRVMVPGPLAERARELLAMEPVPPPDQDASGESEGEDLSAGDG
jgi:hypothetical protein